MLRLDDQAAVASREKTCGFRYYSRWVPGKLIVDELGAGTADKL